MLHATSSSAQPCLACSHPSTHATGSSALPQSVCSPPVRISLLASFQPFCCSRQGCVPLLFFTSLLAGLHCLRPPFFPSFHPFGMQLVAPVRRPTSHVIIHPGGVGLHAEPHNAPQGLCKLRPRHGREGVLQGCRAAAEEVHWCFLGAGGRCGALGGGAQMKRGQSLPACCCLYTIIE